MSKLDFKIAVTALVTLLACGKVDAPPCADCEPSATGGASAGAGTGGTTHTGGNASTAGTGGNASTGGTGGNASTGGTGGTGGNASTGGTGGNASTGGTAGDAGTGGIAGDAGTGGIAGTAGDTGTGGRLVGCVPGGQSPAKLWTLSQPTNATSGGAGGAGGAPSEGGGAGGGDPSGCMLTEPAGSAYCSGEVQVGGTQSEPRLTFADGWVLAYSSTEIAAPVFPGARAWVELRDVLTPICPVCGYETEYSIEVRSAPTNRLLFVELSGTVAQAPSAEVLAQVFGAELREAPICQMEFRSKCSQVTRQQLELTVATVPEQLILHGNPTEISSSSGARFDVFVSWSADTIAPVPGCLDGGPVSADRTFVASQISP